jgi:hypothetical protein
MGYGEEANFILCCSCAVLQCCGSNSNTAALFGRNVPRKLRPVRGVKEAQYETMR